jgi:hypothetical protein
VCLQLPVGYRLDHFEGGDLLEKKSGALLERLDNKGLVL